MKIRLPKSLKIKPLKLKKRLMYLSLCAVGFGLGGYYLLPLTFPIPEGITAGPGSSLMLLDRHGDPLDHWVRTDYYRHRATSVDDLPDDLVKATLAAEDKRFFQHGGVDFRATARAIRDSWEQERFVSGASTITQQTVKISSQRSSRTFTTKIRECLTARHVEMSHSKDEILTSYFNYLDYGNRSQGPMQAARHYFGKPLSQLSLAECALLAGLPQAPSRLNPRRNPEAAVKRRNWILDRMAIVHGLPLERIELAKAEPLLLNHRTSEKAAPHLAQIMRKSRNNASSQTSIHTTISAPLQKDITKIARDQIKALAGKHIQHAAIVVIDNASGEVLAHVGSAHYGQSNNGQIDAARTPRSPGSALKPFTYLAAFENADMTPATIVEDIPTRYSDSRGEKTFVNYNRRHNGPVTIHQALATSLNIPAIRVLNQIGGVAKLHDLLKKVGISTLTEEPTHYGLGLTLGSGEVTLLELTNAYASLARMGKHQPVKYIKSSSTAEPKHFASYQSCWMLAQTMTDNAARSAAFGPSSSLRLPFACAVKTGTSTDFRDNWCLGFTKDFTVGVWVGNLDNTPMRGISGVSGAGPIFYSTMLRLHQDHEARWFERPRDIVSCNIHPHTGKRLLEKSNESVTLNLPVNHVPLMSDLTDYDDEGRVLLDIRYKKWFAQEADKNRFSLSSQSKQMIATATPLRIITPSRQARYLLDPDLPNNGKLLVLKTDFPGEFTWTSPTLKILDSQETHTAILTPGEHMITLTDKQGRKTSRLVMVEQL